MRRNRALLIASIAATLWLYALGHPAGVQADDSLTRALSWLHTQQLPDGSFGLRLADGSYLPSASATADVIYALVQLGEDPTGAAWKQGGKSALDALAVLAPEYVHDAGQAGKIARSVALAGGDPRVFAGLNLVQIIQQAYDPVSGRYDPLLLYRHTLAIEGLLAAGEPVPDAAFTALLQAQHTDGGWFWSFDGDQSDVDTTGRVLQLLAGRARVQAPQAWEKAVRYLYAEQQAAGGWSVGYLPGPPNANSTALAVAGLRSVGYDPQLPCFRKAGQSPVTALQAYQESSGAFVYIRAAGKEESRLMETVDVVSALLEPLAQPALIELAECRVRPRLSHQGPWCGATFGRFRTLCLE